MDKSIKVLVTGANGQLGSELQAIDHEFAGITLIPTDFSTLDITNEAALEEAFSLHQPDYCINCAAYTAVDLAETEKLAAMAINVIGAQNVAYVSSQHKCKLFHISTDFVFNGNKREPYLPSDATEPLGVYGETKQVGEDAAKQYNPATAIFRTSWLYSNYGKNFFKTMTRLGNEKTELNVVDDQTGCPTYAKDLATALLTIINKGIFKAGTYHFANAGNTTWCGFAQSIMELQNLNCQVLPIPTTSYPTPAKRPKYSVLDISETLEVFGLTARDWKVALKDCIAHSKHL